MNAPMVLSVVLMLASLLLLVVLFVQFSRVRKRIREKDGEAVLRENRRLAAALAALCACWVLGQFLGYADRDGASMLGCLIYSTKGILLPAYCTMLAWYVFRKKGMALKEENQSD